MAVSTISFFSRISDPRFGGTYMTLLNTLLNLGKVWSKTVAIGMVDFLTFKQCSSYHQNSCSTENLKNVSNTKIFYWITQVMIIIIMNIEHYVIILRLCTFFPIYFLRLKIYYGTYWNKFILKIIFDLICNCIHSNFFWL